MSTRTKRRRRSRGRGREETNRGTNWIVIGGVIGVAAIALLLFLAVSGGTDAVANTLIGYCEENPTNCAFAGTAEAPVTIVEVSDFGCPHCRDFHEETLPLLQSTYINAGQVRWVVLPFALGETTLPAVNAALCAGEQDAYFAYSDRLFTNFDIPDIRQAPGLQRTAAELGLNTITFNQCLSEGRYYSVIAENGAAARRVGVNSTPTFFVNGNEINGAYPFASFQQQIEPFLGS